MSVEVAFLRLRIGYPVMHLELHRCSQDSPHGSPISDERILEGSPVSDERIWMAHLFPTNAFGWLTYFRRTHLDGSLISVDQSWPVLFVDSVEYDS